jgi:DNA mismatch repair protein MutH
MNKADYHTKEDVFAAAQKILNKSLRDIIPADELLVAEAKAREYGTSRKGYLGNLIEQYVFGLESNNRSEADFLLAGVELKSNPIKKHSTKEYISKERLVFSMIDYDKIIEERWETSTFLQKNKLLLLMFYLYLDREESLFDYEFKFIRLLNLLEDISPQDIHCC